MTRQMAQVFSLWRSYISMESEASRFCGHLLSHQNTCHTQAPSCTE